MISLLKSMCQHVKSCARNPDITDAEIDELIIDLVMEVVKRLKETKE